MGRGPSRRSHGRRRSYLLIAICARFSTCSTTGLIICVLHFVYKDVSDRLLSRVLINILTSTRQPNQNISLLTTIMKTSALALLSAAGLAAAAPLEKRISGVPGFDISNYQPSVNFKGAYSSGARFVIIKATESTDYIDPTFSSHYEGATAAGLIRGGYHFAHPNVGTGAAQAKYFFEHGGGWSDDGRTLPGMLDIEYGSNAECWDVSVSDMVAWIKSFVDEYHSLSKRYPMIYSTADWWKTCTGNTKDFSSNSPLVLADYNSSPGTIPGGWPFQTIWQNSDSYKYGGDSDYFNGSEDELKKIATG